VASESALTLHVPQALVGGRLRGPVRVQVRDGRITRVDVDERRPTAGDVALTRGVLTPGLLDLQNNGSFGVDFATARDDDWSRVLGGLAARGVTGVQPTLVTAPLTEMRDACRRVRDAQHRGVGGGEARILGVHLEGPFLAPARRGAHRAEWMCDPSPQALDVLLADDATRAVLRTVTLAPERQHALAATQRLVDLGYVVSVGHSDATADVVRAAADAGASMVTHVFNAQRPLGHREPGVPGAVLTDDRFFVGTIVDGRHVDPRVVGLIYAAAPGRVVAVTDAVAAAGLPPGTSSHLGGHPVTQHADGLARRSDGTIAGAGIVLDEGVRRMIAAGHDSAVVLSSATEVAARALRRDDLGHLRPGAVADLVWWDEVWQPARVWIGGTEVPLG
jgi:N-acetylglucosamine-6-phosphate deacetylase